CHGKLDCVQGSQAAAEAMLDQQLLREVEMGSGDWHDLPEAGGDVGEEPPARQVEVGGSDLADADKAGGHGEEFHAAKGRDEVAGAGLGEEGIDPRSAHFSAVVLGDGTGVKEAVSHPGPSGSTLLTFGMDHLSERAGDLAEGLADRVEAHAGVG